MMSKRINRFIALLFLLALGMATLLAKHDLRVSAQRANVAGSNVRNAAIVTTTAEVLKETTATRELALLRPLSSRGPPPSNTHRTVITTPNHAITTAPTPHPP